MKLRYALIMVLFLGLAVSCSSDDNDPDVPNETLSVMFAGEGTGSVTSTPDGVDCDDGDTSCTAEFDRDTRVTLTATAGPNSRFAGWSGACAGLTCQLTMDATKNVTATFDASGDASDPSTPTDDPSDPSTPDDPSTPTDDPSDPSTPTDDPSDPGTPRTLTVAIEAPTDDAEEFLEAGGNVVAGQVDTQNGDLDMVNDIGRGQLLVGLRFEDVDLPTDAQISNAYIQFTALEDSSGPVTFTIEGQANNNAPTFSDETPGGLRTQNVSDRPRTTASVSWQAAPWNAGQSGEAQQTADVSSIINEIVGLGNWNPDENGIVFIISGEDTDDASQVRVADSTDRGGNPAELVVTFTSASDPADPTVPGDDPTDPSDDPTDPDPTDPDPTDPDPTDPDPTDPDPTDPDPTDPDPTDPDPTDPDPTDPDPTDPDPTDPDPTDPDPTDPDPTDPDPTDPDPTDPDPTDPDPTDPDPTDPD